MGDLLLEIAKMSEKCNIVGQKLTFHYFTLRAKLGLKCKFPEFQIYFLKFCTTV